MTFKKILAAVDLGGESYQVVSKAHQLSESSGAELLLAHVIEPLTFAYGADVSINLLELQEQLETQARERLGKLAQQFNLDNQQCQVLLGDAADEIHSLAQRSECDLIVVGSHGRSGLSLLLGSTANAVLHGAKCDVLAVRVQPD